MKNFSVKLQKIYIDSNEKINQLSVLLRENYTYTIIQMNI